MTTYTCAHCGKTLTDSYNPEPGQYPKRNSNCKYCSNWVCYDMANCQPCPTHPNDYDW